MKTITEPPQPSESPATRTSRKMAENCAALIRQPSDLAGAGEIIAALERALAAAERENADLSAWKACSMAIEREWDVQELAKLLNAPLGQSCRQGIDAGVRRLVEENRRLIAGYNALAKSYNTLVGSF